MRNITSLVLLVFLLSFGPLRAHTQTVGELTMLGFSADNDYIAFAEYGIDEKNVLFSTLYVVDVDRNVFVPRGVQKRNYFNKRFVGQSAATALVRNTLYESEIIKKYVIDPLNSGRLVYVSLGDEPSTDLIAFDDHEADRSYTLTLHTNLVGTTQKNTLRSSTKLNLSVYEQGQIITSLTIGDPSYYRHQIARYRVHSIYLSNDNSNIAIFLEKYRRNGTDVSIEYMVETARIGQ